MLDCDSLPPRLVYTHLGGVKDRFSRADCNLREICFSSSHERGTINKILSPHEESNLRPSDSALRCTTTDPVAN